MDLIQSLKEREENRKDNFSPLQTARRFDAFLYDLYDQEYVESSFILRSVGRINACRRYSIEITRTKILEERRASSGQFFPFFTLEISKKLQLHLAFDRFHNEIVKITQRGKNLTVEMPTCFVFRAEQEYFDKNFSQARRVMDMADNYFRLPVWLGFEDPPGRNSNPESPPFLFPDCLALQICLHVLDDEFEPLSPVLLTRKSA